ncbi:MAG TPA: fatty acid--CoA ligase family protein [Opitutaceae bacterium]|nr:fatty acid--CoA ligase family protein [Opitutaceae bacterium]
MTSGSTGEPRALAFTDAQMIADGRQICATMGIAPADTNLAVIPFGHSYGLGNLVVPLLIQGTPVVCGAGAFPRAIAADCRRWRPTVCPLVPVILSALARAPIDPPDLSSLRLVVSAGSALAPADAQAFHRRFGLRPHGFYGSSETGGICYDRTGEATLAGSSAGRPLRGVRLFGRPGGRFLVESPAVMGGGRRRPPDLGRLAGSGELILRGRVGRMVKIAGRRLALSEVELALKRIPGVREAAVLPSPRKAEALVAAVAADRDAAEIRRALAGTLAPWKIPQRILAVASLPATARGKADHRRILELFGV